MLVQYFALVAALLSVGGVAPRPKLGINTNVAPHKSPSPSPVDPQRAGWRNEDGTRRKSYSGSPVKIGGGFGGSHIQGGHSGAGTNPPPNTPNKRDLVHVLAKRAALDAYDEIVARYAEPEPEAWVFDFEQGGFVEARSIDEDETLNWW